MATQKNWKVIWKRTKLYIILGIAVFSFAILGMLQGGSEMFSGGGAAAIVNKEVISLGDFMQRASNGKQYGELLSRATSGSERKL